jgi:integrase
MRQLWTRFGVRVRRIVETVAGPHLKAEEPTLATDELRSYITERAASACRDAASAGPAPPSIEDRGNTFARLDPEFHLIATVLVETGLRVSEACGLMVDVPAPEQIVVRGKGAKERIVLLTPAARAALDELGGRIPYRPRTIQRRFRLAGFTPHRLRHTLACDLAASGADLGEIQEILGHSSPATTRIYAAYGTARLRRALERRTV